MADITDPERRRYFRVHDGLRLAYRSLSSAGDDLSALRHSHALSEALDLKLRDRLETLAAASPELAEVFSLLDQKINLLKSAAGNTEQADGEVRVPHAVVSLSACGIAFTAEQAVSAGNRLLISLTLLPEAVHMDLEGEVVACETFDEASFRDLQPPNPWLLRVDFNGIDERQQEQLIQHVLHRQMRDLKRRRLQQEQKND